jgi:hypothetical protein
LCKLIEVGVDLYANLVGSFFWGKDAWMKMSASGMRDRMDGGEKRRTRREKKTGRRRRSFFGQQWVNSSSGESRMGA